MVTEIVSYNFLLFCEYILLAFSHCYYSALYSISKIIVHGMILQYIFVAHFYVKLDLCIFAGGGGVGAFRKAVLTAYSSIVFCFSIGFKKHNDLPSKVPSSVLPFTLD